MWVLEEKMIADNNDTQRIAFNKSKAKLIRHNKVDETFLRQKACLNGLLKGKAIQNSIIM